MNGGSHKTREWDRGDIKVRREQKSGEPRLRKKRTGAGKKRSNHRANTIIKEKGMTRATREIGTAVPGLAAELKPERASSFEEGVSAEYVKCATENRLGGGRR